ncbi:hypothetical protein [Halomarina litorea]|uniref:hypothetical protein n=1 Tax=Halomarina litorea TaxID=2961595 RepID=UPI0020C400D5|nr:hypothetical protein [Halomarina sp. BCD28]
MSRAYRQTPDRSDEREATDRDGTAEDPVAKQRVGRDGRDAGGEDVGSTFEQLVEEMIQSRIGELEREVEALERQLEEVDNFARISLNERKIKQAEGNLSEFSDSLTGFAEKAFDDINELEARMDSQALLLSAVLEGLSEEDIDLDLSEVERYQQDQVVVNTTPEERLEAAVQRF